jgi:hypothetical protein
LDRTAEVLEQPGTAVQDHRGEVQEQLVDQPGRQRLLDDAGAAHDVHQLVPSGHDRLLDGVLDALGDEPERGVALHDHLVRAVGDHEHRNLVEPVLGVPASGLVINLPAGDDRPGDLALLPHGEVHPSTHPA